MIESYFNYVIIIMFEFYGYFSACSGVGSDMEMV